MNKTPMIRIFQTAGEIARFGRNGRIAVVLFRVSSAAHEHDFHSTIFRAPLGFFIAGFALATNRTRAHAHHCFTARRRSAIGRHAPSCDLMLDRSRATAFGLPWIPAKH